jgi:hypothetical protein
MNYQKLNESGKLYLNLNDIADLLSISRESARVTASRYAAKGYLIRLKKDFYITPGKFNSLEETKLFKLANIIQTPSYISLLTALSFYNISTQQQVNYIESMAQKRTLTVNVNDVTFIYSLLKNDMYEGFEFNGDYFIAAPEKALADAVYLTSLGRYNIDFDAIDFGKFDKNKIQMFINKTNKRTKLFWEKLCGSYRILK